MKLQVLKRGRRVFVQQVGNVFCSTGQGGGVDPTCGKGSASSALSDDAARKIQKDIGFKVNDKGDAVLYQVRSPKSADSVQKNGLKASPDFGAVYFYTDKKTALTLGRSQGVVYEVHVPKKEWHRMDIDEVSREDLKKGGAMLMEGTSVDRSYIVSKTTFVGKSRTVSDMRRK